MLDSGASVYSNFTNESKTKRLCKSKPDEKCNIPFLRLSCKNNMALELEKLAGTSKHTNVLQKTKYKQKYKQKGYGNFKKE